jgi:hypothetical protein
MTSIPGDQRSYDARRPVAAVFADAGDGDGLQE